MRDTDATPPGLVASELIDERYRLVRAGDIDAVLARIAMRGTVLSAHADHSQLFILTTVLECNRAAGRLIFESGRDEALNHKLLEANEILFHTHLDGVAVSFLCATPILVRFMGTTALMSPMPHWVQRMQRREFFRINVPNSRPIVLCLPETNQGAALQTAHSVRVADISLGGVVFYLEGRRDDLAPGSLLQGVRLALHREDELVVELEVRNRRFSQRSDGLELTRLGCRFTALDARTAMRLQRTVQKLEVEHHLRNQG